MAFCLASNTVLFAIFVTDFRKEGFYLGSWFNKEYSLSHKGRHGSRSRSLTDHISLHTQKGESKQGCVAPLSSSNNWE